MQAKLALWQSKRLIHTHQDFYHDYRYHTGLQFLFNDLYSHQDFSERDRDLERIFPKLVKLLPSKVLDTVSIMVELNLLTQQLDQALCEQLAKRTDGHITPEAYCSAYQACDNQADRQRQLSLVHEAGLKLERYAHSQTIMFALRISEGPAEMAGLSALYNFLKRGFSAFHSMQDVAILMETIVQREHALLQQIFDGLIPNTFTSFIPEQSHD
ncbi:MAG: hypothetical protein R3183_00125 [Oleiphilaceae bacterium]|nr:hypothetical protein [Oleiphilaceae bacterium]